MANGTDPAEFRSGQRGQWNDAARGWKKWSDLIESGASLATERLVELAGVSEGGRVLDVAAGYGEPTLTAAKRVGPSGNVVATDISPEMLAFGRERAAAAGIENVEFVESDAISLDYPARTFDAALSRFGIIFDPDAEGAAARVREFLEPGGRFAISSWGTPDRVPFLGIPVRIVVERLGVDPPPPGAPGPLSRPTPEALAGLLEGGGFSDIRVEEADVAFKFDSAADFTTWVREIAPPITALMADHPADEQEETWAAITEGAKKSTAEDGSLSLSNLALLAVGRA